MTDSVFDIEANTAPYINDQLPSIYRDYAGGVASFLQAYYTWLGQPGNVMAQSARFMLDCDVDTTLPEFLIHFEKTYMAGFPYGDLDPSAIVPTIKHIKDVIASKGSVVGLKYMFALVYGVDASIYTPGSDIFKPSDNRWSQKIYIELSYSPLISQVVGSTITGVTSGATAYVYGFQRQSIEVAGSSSLPPSDSWGQANTAYTQSLTYSGGSRLSYALNIEDVAGQFIVGEAVKFSGIQPTQDNTPIVIGSLGSIDIYQGGIDFAVPDPLAVDIASSDPNIAFGATAVVSNTISRNGVVQFVIANQGQGYVNSTTDPSNFMGQTISLTQANTNPGAGATFDVGTLSNTFILTTSNDFIQPYANTLLSAPSYGMPSFPSANLATTLGTALNFQSIVVGQISALTHINQGAGYTGEVFVSVVNPVVASLNMGDGSGGVSGNDAAITGDAGRGVGAIQSVVVKQSGVGYVEGQHLGLTSPNDPESSANGIARLSGTGLSIGAWSGTNSFLDNDKKIQDSYYYQSFSYEIDSPLSPETYVDVVKSDWHVAGMQLFGRVVAQIEEDEVIEDQANNSSSEPINVSAYPFYVGDGVSNTAVLTYQNQRVTNPTVIAMHQTDWQGRVALSNQPRTNYALSSQNMLGTGWNINTETVTNNNPGAPDGTATLNKVVISTQNIYHVQVHDQTGVPNGLCSMHVYINPSGAPFTTVWLADQNASNFPMWYVVLDSTGKVTANSGNLASGKANVTPGPNGTFLVSIQGVVTAGIARIVSAFSNSGAYPSYTFTGNGTDSYDLWGLMFSPGIGIDQFGIYIPTTSAPVTVTDYAVDSSGDISLGQTPAANAILDWSGAGYVQQSGNFKQVPVSVANAQFMVGDGKSNTANLLDGSGNIVIDPTVTAVRQTDWQGTTTLSSTPRTNYFQDVSAWNLLTGTTITASSAFPDAVTVKGSATSGIYGTQGNSYNVTGAQVVLYVSAVFAKAAGSFAYLQFNYTPSGQGTSASLVYIDLGTGALGISQSALTWQNLLVEAVPNGFRLSLAVVLDAGSGLYPYVGPANGITNNQDNRATSNASIVVGAIDLASAAGVHIATTSAPVTVTDYAPNPNFKNQLLLGQTPSVNATLNWDGSGYIVQPD